ncbi:Glutamyl-tRNA synthetase [Mucinivorans hirudinis]|uniref:Glutamate--tRNA ligase n=1 Tax=Mucinivorans hirudinis TaxID=1433126 RepID=A0A060RAY4_9BACT|nr:Glutamyl-tRNA synthetase [Mucinivorans hirudinis]
MVRVRFAPSPTGALHIGGVRTALYNYFFARQNGGKFILRIEDTDSARFVPGAEAYIIESLKWAGIEIDEGVSVGGPHAPYRQSERREIYLKYALELVEKGWAYYAFDTPEELDAIRAENGETFSYNYTVREKLATSLNLSAEEVEERLARGDQWVIRFKMPEGETIEMDDLVRGHISVNSSTLDDKVLYKSSDKLPTYHLANIVDDRLMEITHVIRGEEWLPSLPLHYMLYRAFGWSSEQPLFAHLPLLLKPTGSGKLSKRDGDKLGFPVFPLQWQPTDGSEGARGYREDGYLPEAFVNMLALLGWNPGNDHSEIMTMEEMISLFSIDKVGKSGSRFDPEKAKWFNAQYLHTTSNEVLVKMFRPVLEEKNIKVTDEKLEKIVGIVKERATFVSDLWELSKYFFEAPQSYDEKVVAKFWTGDNPAHLVELKRRLIMVEDFTAEKLESVAKEWIHIKELPMGKIMNTLRLALVGTNAGANLFEIAQIIGREEFNRRIERAHNLLG